MIDVAALESFVADGLRNPNEAPVYDVQAANDQALAAARLGGAV
jgi:hypothetical protein